MIKYFIGIDEVGRGPVAGPVCVGAFLVKVENKELVKSELTGITDSKKLTENKRVFFYKKILDLKEKGLVDFAISCVPAQKIDVEGIVPAIREALGKALCKVSDGLNKESIEIFLDGGLKAPEVYLNQETIIRGDGKVFEISCASVVAKVYRDDLMRKMAKKYPGYGFEKHKGYGTKAHMKKIGEFGLSEIHRRSFLGRFL